MMRYLTNCTNAKGDDVTEMVEQSKQITRRTFLKHVDPDDLRTVAKTLGYSAHHSQGLHMSADSHVTYHASWYRTYRCYYFTWSAIEFIFR